MYLVRLMWRSASESKPVHSRYSRLSQAWRTAKPIQTMSAVSNWCADQKERGLWGREWIWLMWSTAPEPGLTVTRFFSTYHNSLLRIATNEIASFCIDHRSHQMAFFRAKEGQRRAKGRLSRYVEIFWNKKGFSLLYKTNRFHAALRLFSNRSQMTSKCGKNISDTLDYASCATFLFLPHFDAVCDLLLNRRTATWILLVK